MFYRLGGGPAPRVDLFEQVSGSMQKVQPNLRHPERCTLKDLSTSETATPGTTSDIVPWSAR